jgi:hypothetical protein
MLDSVAAEDRELRDHLKAFSDTFAVLVMTAADHIVEDPGTDAMAKRNARLWALRMVPQCNTLSAQSNPRVALIDVIAFVARQRKDLETGVCRDIFGSRQDVALQAARDAEAAAWETAARVMNPGERALLRSQIEEWVVSKSGDGFLAFDRIALLAKARARPRGITKALHPVDFSAPWNATSAARPMNSTS